MQGFNFMQLVLEPTHIRGRLFDHANVNQHFHLFHRFLATIIIHAYCSHNKDVEVKLADPYLCTLC